MKKIGRKQWKLIIVCKEIVRILQILAYETNMGWNQEQNRINVSLKTERQI